MGEEERFWEEVEEEDKELEEKHDEVGGGGAVLGGVGRPTESICSQLRWEVGHNIRLPTN